MLSRMLSCKIIALLLLVSAPIYAAQELTIGYGDQESFPYVMGVGYTQPDPPGIYVELLNKVASNLGIVIHYRRLPWKRVQEYLKTGEIDGGFDFSFKTERLEFGRYPMKAEAVDGTRRLATLSYHLYALKDSKLAWDGKNLTGLTAPIGANLGYSIVADLKKMGVNVDEIKDTESNLKKLQAGRISGYAQLDAEVDYFLQPDKYGTTITKLPIPLVTKEYFVIFGHKWTDSHAELAEQFWTHLGEIRDAQIQQLLPKYQALKAK